MNLLNLLISVNNKDFVNTLFSYMRMKKGRKLSVVSRLKRRMLEEFPDFRKNRSCMGRASLLKLTYNMITKGDPKS